MEENGKRLLIRGARILNPARGEDYVGNILIACVGVNLLFPNKISVANMLPGLIVAIVWAFLPL